MYERELESALIAVRAAGGALRTAFHAGFSQDVDADVEQIIYGTLAPPFPGYGYRGEELGLVSRSSDKRRHLWLVDPHDGTSAAKRGYRGASVSIALLCDGVPVLGVVYAYCAPDDLGDLFWWAYGLGSIYRNGNAVERVWSDEPSDASTVLISQDADRVAEINAELVAPMRFRAVPGIAYRLALVAAGEADAAVSLNGPTGWDFAGGHALLRGAGGNLFNADGNPVTYDRSGSTAQSKIYYGGLLGLVKHLFTQRWNNVFSSSALPSAADSLNYLNPGRAIRNPGILSRAQGCLLGLVAGDALGSLVEFQSAESIARHYPDGPRLLEDGGTWGTIAGQPTDDSELALSLARSIVQAGRYEDEAAATAYARWRDSNPFDIGHATSAALSGASKALQQQRPVAEAATSAALTETQANGALMRVAPLGIYGTYLPPHELHKLARIDAGLTHPHEVCRAASGVFTAAIAFAIGTGRGAEATYGYTLTFARSEAVSQPVLQALENAKQEAPTDFLRNSGWVLIALQNAFYQLLRASSFEDGIVGTVRAGGDTDTNAAIAGALLGAVYGRDALPAQWKDRVLTCRPIQGIAGVRHPRPAAYWPVDALPLSESLLLTGLRSAGATEDAFDGNVEDPRRRVVQGSIIHDPPVVWDGVDRVEPSSHRLDANAIQVVRSLTRWLPRLRQLRSNMPDTVTSERTPDGTVVVTIEEPARELASFFNLVYDSFGARSIAESPVPTWLTQPDFIERAEFPQLRTVLSWMQRVERFCWGFWDGVLRDGSLIRVLERLSSLIEET